jgi:drug/metabolite transporter (DMT)-like permease
MRTGIIFALSSLFGAILSFVVLREAFTFIQLIAGSVMLLGIYVLYRCGEQIRELQTWRALNVDES